MDAVVKHFAQPAREGAGARPGREEAEAAVRTLIAYVGDDPDREGLIETPARVVRAWEELCRGYRESPAAALERTFEDVGGYDDLVLVRDIPFVSHCEHHMLPILGRAHVAYYPGEVVVGLSKLARLVDVFAKRLQTQEKLNTEIADALHATLKPRGAAVMIDAEHLCMSLRGACKGGARTVTTRFTGLFRDDPGEQLRFLALLGRGEPG